MTEKIVRVEVFVDTTKAEQVNALTSLLNAIGSMSPVVKSNKETDGVPAGTSVPSVPSVPGAEPARRRGRPRKDAVEPGETAPAETTPEETLNEEAVPESAPSYTVEEVREKLREKVADHRETIKAKLTELGAPNVSSLDPSKYDEFVNFLESL